MQDLLFDIMVRAIVLFTAIPVHEAAHGWLAYKMGDPTAKYNGRLTLNPFAHFDKVGTISLLLFGIGWARPVPVNANNFKNPKWGMCLTALAGPVSNILMAYISLILAKIFLYAGGATLAIPTFETLFVIFRSMAFTNIALAIFNLLPLPPFDGSRIFGVFLPAKWYFKIMQYERYIFIGIMICLFTGILSLPLGIFQSMLFNMLNKASLFVEILFGLI